MACIIHLFINYKYRQVAKLHLFHLQHTLKKSGNCENFKILFDTAKIDFIFNFVETSRFSDVKWKNHAIALAKKTL